MPIERYSRTRDNSRPLLCRPVGTEEWTRYERARDAAAALRSASSSPLEESSRPGAAQFHASRHSLDDPVGLGGAAGNLWGAATGPEENASEQDTGAPKSRLWSYTSAQVV